MTRGIIRNREAARRLRDFSGLRWGVITPTDIDAFLDFGNRAFVVIEAKRAGAKMPVGQSLALRRMVTALSLTAPALLVVAEHACDTEDINLGSCQASRYYTRGRWYIPKGEKTTRQVIDAFRRFARVS